MLSPVVLVPAIIPPVAKLGIDAKAAKTPLTAVAIKAGVVNTAAGPVAVPEITAPLIAEANDCESIIAISCIAVSASVPIKPSKPFSASPKLSVISEPKAENELLTALLKASALSCEALILSSFSFN